MPTGEQGQVGPAGAPGEAGGAGQEGPVGFPGRDGKQGPQGTPGFPGAMKLNYKTHETIYLCRENFLTLKIIVISDSNWGAFDHAPHAP